MMIGSQFEMEKGTMEVSSFHQVETIYNGGCLYLQLYYEDPQKIHHSIHMRRRSLFIPSHVSTGFVLIAVLMTSSSSSCDAAE